MHSATTDSRPPRLVGYSVLRSGEGEGMEVCVVLPHVEIPVATAFDPVARRLDVRSRSTSLTLPDVPKDVSRLLTGFPSAVMVVTTDALNYVHSATRHHPMPGGVREGVEAAALFNDFMTRAVRRGAVSASSRRVRVRQPENEAFVRKALAALNRLAPGTDADAASVELPDMVTRGPANLAEAAAEVLGASPSLSLFLGEPGMQMIRAEDLKSPALDLFNVLHAYAFLEVTTQMGVAPAFGTCAATVAATLSAQSEKMKPRVLKAADSVFSQSFADVHAITLCAAFLGRRTAQETLIEVARRRTASGDLDAFSLAPLSHDTGAALEILKAQLASGKDFGGCTRLELWANSIWVAAEALGTWMERHGADSRASAAVTHALESVAHVLAAASGTTRTSSGRGSFA